MKKFLLMFSLSCFALLAVLIFSMQSKPVAAQTSAEIHTYTPDYVSVFTNPERGYHNRYEIIDDPSVNDYASSATSIAGFNPDMLDRTFARAKQNGNTIIHSYIHLDKYQDTDVLPQALLDNLDSGLDAIRDAGLKIVVRPAYTWSQSPNVQEDRILAHIAQINGVLAANADVVLHLEAGYLGPWGEWHTSIYTASSSREYADNRYRIIKQIVSTVPSNIPVAIRYPIFYKEMMELPAPAGTTAFTQEERDRIGFHNDCFLADSADMGTYDNNSWMGWFYIEEKKQWMYDMETSFGANKIMGGETCDSAGYNDTAGVNVQTEMSLLNFTEINEDFAQVNTDIWKNANLAATGNDPAETAFVRLKRKMGYRLSLLDATFPDTASAGGAFPFSASLLNEGYAGLVKARPVYLVFEDGTNRFNILLDDVDARLWLAGSSTIPVQNLTLPSDMPAGTYRLALWLPDASSNLQSRPEYSVRFANQNMWDATAGFNVLSTNVVVGPGCPSCPTSTPPPTATQGPTATATLTPTIAPSQTATATATTPPPTATPDGSSYEAETATLGGSAVTASCASCSNGQKVGYVGNNDGTLQFSGIQSASAETVTLTIHYTSGEARSVQMSVNGGSATTVNFPSSGGWSTVGTVQVNVSLVSGSNTVAFSNPSGWAPDFDRITLSTSGGGPTSTPVPTGTANPTNTPAPTNTPSAPTATPQATPQATSTPSGSALIIDSFSDVTQWNVNHLNDLGESVDCTTMGSCYYGDANPGNIVMNSSAVGQFYEEEVNRDLSGYSTLTLRMRDWWNSDTEDHWNIVLNDGSDHTVSLNSYGDVTAEYQNITIPLSAFGANLSNVVSIRLVHKDTTYAVLLIDTIAVE